MQLKATCTCTCSAAPHKTIVQTSKHHHYNMTNTMTTVSLPQTMCGRGI